MIKPISVEMKISIEYKRVFFSKGGLRQGKAFINGSDVFKSLKYECGVHRVQRVPQTEKSGRIHTSTVMVAVLPQPKDVGKCLVE
jgi:protein subunit release factor A